jgi:ferredoxin
MHVTIDASRCQGHGRCYDAADDLFDADDIGHAHVSGSGDVPEARQEAARLAAASCPERAITIGE